MAGFDCSEAVIFDSYELSFIVKKRKVIHHELNNQFAEGTGPDGGVFSHLKKYFPYDIEVSPEIKEGGGINWESISDYYLPALKDNRSFCIFR